MTILATIIVLGVLIFVHELGHFAAAKLVGIDVERFSIGIGPVVWGVTRGETEYVLSAIPLGGYVKMGGMADEVMEKIEGGPTGGGRAPRPGDFDAKPLWARAFVISAGVIMNMIFAFAAYTVAVAGWGRPVLETTRLGDVRETLLPAGAEMLADIEPGSRVERVGDREVEHWGDLQSALLEAPPGPITIHLEDPARELPIRLPSDTEARRDLVRSLSSWRGAGIGAVNPGSPADRGGLERGDVILSVDGTPVDTWYDFVRAVEGSPGRRTELRIRRDGSELVRVVTPETAEQRDPVTGEQETVGKVGVYPQPDDYTYLSVGVLEAVEQGFQETLYFTGVILGFLWDLISGDISPRSVGSIVTIGEASGQAAAQGMETFLRFMALFSINLAILNLLPIPVLDGGHLVFLGIEAVRGRAVSVEQRMRWSQVGFLIVVGIMIWALSNDFLRLLGL